jgi:flagellar protein FliS
MIANNAYGNKISNQYRKNTVFLSTPEELTLMLYNGVIKFILQAQAAVNENHIEKANDCIIRVQEILGELQATLDMKYDISSNLRLLYDYMHQRLIEANIKKDKEILEEVLGFAKELRDVWTQAMKIAKKQDRAKEA